MAQVFFRFFVEEEHAVVGKTDFTGAESGTAANKGDVRDSMVGRAERAVRDERCAAFEQSGHGVDLRGFEAFGKRELRQYGRQALRHHAFAAAGRPY